MKRWITLFSIAIVLGCSKSEKPGEWVVCPEPETWLAAKVKEYAGCACLTEIRKGTLKGKPVVWIALVDPLCNGIDSIYNADGSVLTTTADAPAFKAVKDQVTDFTTIWNCSKN